MRTNRWFLTVGVAAMMVTGWSSLAEASTCTASTDCPDSAPICAAGICKPCSDGLIGGLSCLLSGHPTFSCVSGSCVDPNASALPTTTSSSSSSSSSTGGIDLGGVLGSSSSSSSGSTNLVCVADSDCGDDKSGQICNAATHACVAGCRVGSHGCLLDLVCTGLVGDVGVCLIPSVPTTPPVTNPSCSKDADCGELLSGTVCGTDNKCVPGCRLTGGNSCPINLDCFANTLTLGICVPPTSPTGCTADSQCGGSLSGEVCDITTGSCIPGCRVDGGNGCPLGLTCDLSFDSFGLCILPPSSSSSSSGSNKTVDAGPSTTYPESRNPIPSSSGGTDAGVAASGGADLDVSGGGCNVSNNDTGAGASLAGLLFGAAVLVSRRRKNGGKA